MVIKTDCKTNCWKKFYLYCLLLILFSAIVYVELPGAADYPHNESSNGILCSECHTGEPPGRTNLADTTEVLCGKCHTGKEVTHSSRSTSGTYGTWSVECITCHDAHLQQQVSIYGSASYLFTSEATSVTSGTPYSTIIRNGAGWTEHEWAGMLVIGNTASSSPVFHKIHDNTADTLTIEGPLTDTVQGNTFAIVYGGLIKNAINYTKTNVTPNVPISGLTKLFRNTGIDSLTNGTPTADIPPVSTQGICMICHTETLWHKNDGSGADHYAGQDCITCHRHEAGFNRPAVAGDGSANSLGGTGKGSINVVLAKTWAPGDSIKELNDPGAAYDPVTKVCTGIYCHSNGTAAGVASASTPPWTSTFAQMGGDPCAKCHANSPTGTPAHAAHVVGIHYDNIFTGTSGTAQPGGAAASAHGNPTTSTTINCNVCHYNTVQKARNMQNSVCYGCHSGDSSSTGALSRGDIDKRYHVSTGSPDVAFAPAAILSKAQLRNNIATVAELNNSWSRISGYKSPNSRDSARSTPSYASGSCSSIDCHNGNAVSWSAGSLSCRACHTALPL